MDAAYLKAAVPEPFKILGKKLRPFCLGHEILFQRFGNSFSVENANAPTKEEHALIGIHICSKPYRADFTIDDFAIPLMARIAGVFHGRKVTREAVGMFADYIAAHTEIPEFDTLDESAPADFGSPTVQSVKVSLMANLGLSEEAALNTPYSLAYWNHFSFQESKGVLRIIDDRRKQEIEAAEAFESKVEEMRRKVQARIGGQKCSA